MANTRFLPFPKLLYIIRVRVLVEPAGDKPFSFFFSVPGKDSIDRIEIRLQFLLRREEEAAIGGRKSLSLPFGRLPTSFARFNATPSKRKASRSSFSSWRRRIVSGTQGVATLHPGANVAGDDDWDTAAIAFFDSYDQHELLAVRIPHDKHDMEADPRS